MKGYSFTAIAAIAVSGVGCGGDGSDTEVGRRHADIVAGLKAIEQGVNSAADVGAALGKYEVAKTEIETFQNEFPLSEEAAELAQALKWVGAETARLRTIQEANQPPPTPSPEFYK